MRLSAPSTRWPAILIMAMRTQHIRGQAWQQAQHDGTRRKHSDAHERPARCGSAAGEGGGGVHGESWWEGNRLKRGAVETAMEAIVNSLYPAVNSLVKLFLKAIRFQRKGAVPSRNRNTRATKFA